MGVIQLTTGVPGSGKTYLRCAKFISQEYLVQTRGVRHYSNFPINKEEMVEAVYRNQRGFFSFFSRLKPESREEIAERIVLIPEDVTDSWRHGYSSPVDYFRNFNLSGCHIAIDEFHEFLNVNTPYQIVQQWEDWLATIRHTGCTLEALTQDPSAVNPVFMQRISERVELMRSDSANDPYLGISLYDWSQLISCWAGKHIDYGYYDLKIKGSSGRYRLQERKIFKFDAELYKLYNSYSGGGDIDLAKVHPYLRFNRFSIIAWFLLRNLHRIFVKFLLYGVLIWLCFCGGIGSISKWFMDSIRNRMGEQVNVLGNKTDNKDNVPDNGVGENDTLPVQAQTLQEEKPLLEIPTSQKYKVEQFRVLQVISPDFVVTDDGLVIQDGEAYIDKKGRLYEKARIDFRRNCVVFDGCVLLLSDGGRSTTEESGLQKDSEGRGNTDKPKVK